jgi:hypothetical protein
MTQFHLKPVAGRAIPDPENGYQLLDSAGAAVEASVYWQRRLDAGDVIEYDPAAITAPEATSLPADPASEDTETPAKANKGSKAQ